MNILRFFLVALVWGLLCHGNARADVILRGFDPVVPTAGQIPSLVLDIIRGGGITTCEGARADVPAKVAVQGSLIVVKLYMGRFFIGNPFCQTVPSSIGLRWPLESTVPAGTYTVRVFGCSECFGDPPFSPEFLIGELPITVLAADVSVPLLGLPQLILFSFTLLLVGVWRLRNTTQCNNSTPASQLGTNGLRIRSPTKREKSRSALHNSLTLCSKQVAAMRAS